MAVNIVKGTRDIIGEEANAFNYIENLLKQICIENNVKEKFTYIWTIKESMFKSSGTEKSREPKAIVIKNMIEKISKYIDIYNNDKNMKRV